MFVDVVCDGWCCEFVVFFVFVDVVYCDVIFDLNDIVIFVCLLLYYLFDELWFDVVVWWCFYCSVLVVCVVFVMLYLVGV